MTLESYINQAEAYVKDLRAMVAERDAIIADLRAEVAKRDALLATLADWIIQHGEDGDGDEVENAIRLMELQSRKLDAVPVDAIRAVLVEWAAHGMRMTDSTTAVIEWLGSLGGDA